METKQLIQKLNEWNKTKMVKIQGTEKERLIFENDETWNIFGKGEDGILIPFNDYSYTWLSCFFDDLTDYLKEDKDLNEQLENFRENLNEYIDGRVDIYTSDLTAWLHDNNGNVAYFDDVLKEYGKIDDGFKLLAMAQYKAIEEIYYNALDILEKEIKENE